MSRASYITPELRQALRDTVRRELARVQPRPHDWRYPVRIQDTPGVGGPWIRFTLSSALITTEASESASVAAAYNGASVAVSDSITVWNMPTHTAGTYVFEGDSGDVGYAMWDQSGSKWWIWQMECP